MYETGGCLEWESVYVLCSSLEAEVFVKVLKNTAYDIMLQQ